MKMPLVRWRFPIEFGFDSWPTWKLRLWRSTTRAMTFSPFYVVYTRAAFNEAGTVAHERWHVTDQHRWLLLPWYATYLFCAFVLMQGEGRKNLLEREAYRRGDEARGLS